MRSTNIFSLISIMMVLSISSLYAQKYEWQKPMQPKENYKATITDQVYAGLVFYEKNGKIKNDYREIFTIEYLYSELEIKAKIYYGNNIVLRQFVVKQNDKADYDDNGYMGYSYSRVYELSAIVAVPAPSEPDPVYDKPTPQTTAITRPENPLEQAINKALQDIKEGSRLALDVVRIANGDKEDFKDQIVEILLNEGYKVVAKDYLEKLYQEQQDQQSGIYNDRTTVQENNFSAVGYYINVKQTETAIKVQVINVSTGEYEANVTINLD